MDNFDFAAFANSIGKFYQLVDQEMGDFLQNNIDTLSADPNQLKDFRNKQETISGYAKKFFASFCCGSPDLVSNC